MATHPRRAWSEHRLLAAALAFACLLAVVFGLRVAISVIYWSEHRDLPIQGWMTLGFVAHSWEVDRRRLAEALPVAPAPGERATLADIAERSGRPLSEITAILERRIAEQKARGAE